MQTLQQFLESETFNPGSNNESCNLDGQTHRKPTGRFLDVNVPPKSLERGPFLGLGEIGWVLSREERLGLQSDVRQILRRFGDSSDIHHYM